MRPAIGLDALDFVWGRAGKRVDPGYRQVTGFADDLKLFATTFVGAFLFVAVYLA